MKIPLEDLFEDIVGKAQRGLQISDQELGRRAHLGPEELRPLKKGSGTPAGVPGLAEALGLGPKALSASYSSSWYPTEVPLVASAVAVPPVPGEAATTTPRQAVSEISDASGTATAATLVIEERMGGSPSRGKLSDEVTNVSIN